jgi:hypothetical protein
MKKIGCISRLSNPQPSRITALRLAGGIASALLLTMAGIAAAQLPAPDKKMDVPAGYKAHQSVDVGGHVVGLTGSGAMYDTLVNTQTGPRMLGESFELRALPGNTHSLVDSLHAIGNGFGGDPNSFAKLTFEKGKLYEFTGVFRRDRQYFDYDLLGNPNIPGGQSIPIGPSNKPTGTLAWPQVNQSPVMFNTVRRMLDTDLTLLPLSVVTFRLGYSHNIFQGPTLSPAYSIAKYDALLQQYQRNSTDEFTGGIDWKPVRGTRISFEEEITNYKADSYFTLNPAGFMVQEADGTPAYLGNWDSVTPYGIGGCNTNSMGAAYNAVTRVSTILTPAASGGLPVINAACDVVTSYSRTQPTRILTPTETFLLQSSSIKNISMNGSFSYTSGNMKLPSYYESAQGLDGVAATTTTPVIPAQGIRSIIYSGGSASASRQVAAGDFGIIWQAAPTFTLADQIDYSNVQQPGTSNDPISATVSTPATAGNETITYSGTMINGNAYPLPHGINGVPTANFYGQRQVTNNLTASWEVTPRATLALTYRYKTQTIAQGVPHNVVIPAALADPVNGTVTINENGGILNAAFRPTQNWSINGTVEALYDDNAFTAVSARQTRHYRVHTLYRPKPWATVSAAFNDLERHNNTNNNQASGITYFGPLNHVDYSRVFSMSADLTPNEHYGLDLSYAYSDVYAATNICYLNAASATLPGAATAPGSIPASVTQTGNVFSNGVCNFNVGHTSVFVLGDWYGRDFTDAPTQYVSAAVMLSPNDKIHSSLGYRISDVSGSRFFNDARDVNGSLVSKYQSPFVSVAWTIRKGMIAKAEYNYFGYGEGGPSGAPECSTTTTPTSIVAPCTSFTQPTGLTETSAGLTAPRNFHANNVTLGMHYEF